MVNEQPVRTNKKMEMLVDGRPATIVDRGGVLQSCRADARMGGFGIANTITSLLCHSYMQRRKQAEERRNAIPEVVLKMEFLQQVDAEAKDMRKGWKATIKAETEEDVEGRADQGCLKKEETPDIEKDKIVCSKQNV